MAAGLPRVARERDRAAPRGPGPRNRGFDRSQANAYQQPMHVRAVLAGFNLAPPEGSNWMLPAAAWFIVALPVCLAGLGLIARRIPGMGRVEPELLPALGLAAFTVAGGVLNLLRLAFPPAIWILLAAGLLAFARAAWKGAAPLGAGGSKGPQLRANAGAWLLGGLVFCQMLLALAAHLAPEVYNWQDDLQKYFVHPVRMLQTGTVFGSPLSAIGAESLGGIAFVQSCALLWLPIRAIDGADAILGLLLCLIPLLAFGLRQPGLRWVAAVAIASTVVIDPHIVNVSALFLGSALIMAAVLLTSGTDAPGAAFTGGRPVAVGLVYAALVALKPTFVLFVGPHLVAVACAAALAQSSTRAGLRWGAATAACTACFLAPWVLVHLPHYLAPTLPGSGARPALLHNPVSLMGMEPVEMGFARLRPYTILVFVLAGLAAACVGFRPGGRWRTARYMGAAVGAAVAVAAYPFVLFAFPRIIAYADFDAAEVRYFIPLALGIFPIALCVASHSFQECALPLSRAARLGLSVTLGLVPFIYFSERAADRYEVAISYRTLQPVLARAMEYALGSAKMAEVRSQQDRIPRGSSLIAWIYEPFFLDYSRNTIFDAEVAGISNPWAVLPAADYILWEYRGYPDLKARTQYLLGRLPAVNRGRSAPLAEFERRLSEQLKSGTVIFKNEEFVLLRTAKGGP